MWSKTTNSQTVPDRCPLCCEIPLTNGKVALIDPVDWVGLHHLPWKAKKSRGGWYAYYRKYIKGKGIMFYMHRLITGAGAGHQVHHKNSNPLDNRRNNLELLTESRHQETHTMLRISKRRSIDVTRQN